MGMLPVVVINQLAMIVAFMPPLKIIILLGSEGMPAYLAVIFGELFRNALIIYLGVGAVLFLLIYFIGGRLVIYSPVEDGKIHLGPSDAGSTGAN